MSKHTSYMVRAFAILSIAFSNVLYAAVIPLDINVTIRDFHQIHPDFQNSVSGVTTNMVGTSLVGGVPVFIGADNYGAVNNANTFASWYADCNPATPSLTCVNSYNVDLSASVDTSTGELTYNSNSFFPLDSITGTSGDGDNFNNHNYFFTAQFELDLIYDPNLTNTFSFTGDDDVWVFINGTRELDLGGVHGAATAGFDMNTVAANQGIQAGELYKFSFFFAERHFSQSNVNITSYLGAPADIPEPTNIAVLALSLLGLFGITRNKVPS